MIDLEQVGGIVPARACAAVAAAAGVVPVLGGRPSLGIATAAMLHLAAATAAFSTGQRNRRRPAPRHGADRLPRDRRRHDARAASRTGWASRWIGRRSSAVNRRCSISSRLSGEGGGAGCHVHGIGPWTCRPHRDHLTFRCVVAGRGLVSEVLGERGEACHHCPGSAACDFLLRGTFFWSNDRL